MISAWPVPSPHMNATWRSVQPFKGGDMMRHSGAGNGDLTRESEGDHKRLGEAARSCRRAIRVRAVAKRKGAAFVGLTAILVIAAYMLRCRRRSGRLVLRALVARIVQPANGPSGFSMSRPFSSLTRRTRGLSTSRPCSSPGHRGCRTISSPFAIAATSRATWSSVTSEIRDLPNLGRT